MSFLKSPLLFIGSQGEKVLQVLFSSGASLSCVRAKSLENLGQSVKLGVERRIDIIFEAHFIKVTHAVRLDFYINDVLLSDEFLVVPNLSEDAIIGAATLQKWRIKLDFEHDQVIVDPKVAKLQLI
ncbi:MAG: hypothetical protein ACTHMM_05785 [Agriterribacter sp.]